VKTYSPGVAKTTAEEVQHKMQNAKL